MAAGELIGCFGLTEPTAGSDPASMAHPRRPRRRRLGARPAPSAGSGWPRSPTSRSSGRRPTRAIRGSSSRPRHRGLHRHRRSSRSCRCAPRSSATSPWTACGCPPTRCCPASAGLEGPVRLPQRGPLRDHVGRDGRRPRRLRDRAAPTRWSAASSARRSRRSSSRSRSSSTWCWRSRRACWSRCRPGGSRTPARSAPSRSRSASSTTSARPSRSAGRRARSSAATASRWSTRRCGTPTTSRACAPTRAPTRCTR